MKFKNATTILKTLSLLSIMLIIMACPKPDKYPLIPQLTFKRVELSDSTDLLGNKVKNYRLVFEIIDGDGDIGLNLGDTLGMFHKDSIWHNNLFLSLYEQNDGLLELLNEDIKYRTPYVQPQGQNKNLKADILIDYQFTYVNQQLKHDSIMFEFYMYDRTFNKSNIESSPVFFIDTIGTFPTD